MKGGDFRSRDSNVHRLAEVSGNIIDQCTAQGVPFAREYGGLLDNRSFGGAQVSRTFYARGQTGQQLLIGCYQALEKEVAKGGVEMFTRTEMLDLVVVDGHAKGVIMRNLKTGEITKHAADAVILATGGYGNVFYLSTNAMGCNVMAAWKAHKKGAYMANPCYTQIHPTCIPVSGAYQSKLTLMSESLRNDGRIWVPNSKEDAEAIRKGEKKASDIADKDRDYYLERKYPSFGNLAPRDIASRSAKEVCDEGRGVAKTGLGVYLDFRDAIERLGEDTIRERYGNLFQMYEKITGENPYKQPMQIFPAVHYTMGGLWVDYNLSTNVDGLYSIGESNFADHGANRLGASSLMQCLADGYFVLPVTIGDYLSRHDAGEITTDHDAFEKVETEVRERINTLINIKGDRSAQSIHRELGKIMWEHCGIARTKASLEEGLEKIPELRKEFWSNLRLPGGQDEMNQSLEHAGRVADFLEFGELMCRDALLRDESCGCHLREEYQTEEGEAKRNDEKFAHVSVFEFKGVDEKPELTKEPLSFEALPLADRNYKS